MAKFIYRWAKVGTKFSEHRRIIFSVVPAAANMDCLLQGDHGKVRVKRGQCLQNTANFYVQPNTHLLDSRYRLAVIDLGLLKLQHHDKASAWYG